MRNGTAEAAPEVRTDSSRSGQRTGELRRELERLASRLPALQDRTPRLSEEDTKRILITPLLRALGWDADDPDEMRNEYRHGRAADPVDYALLLDRTPVLFVEAKALGQNLDDLRWRNQTLSYANVAGVDWCVLTNGAEYRIYKVHAPGEADKKLFATANLRDSAGLDAAAEILGLFGREQVRAGAMNELWQATFADRLVQEALSSVLQGDAFARLVRSRLSQSLPLVEVRASLARAIIRVEFPPRPGAPKSAAAGVDRNRAAQQGLGDTADQTRNITRSSGRPKASASGRRFQSTRDLFELGRIKTGDVLRLRGRPGSEARVLSGNEVEYRGDRLSYLAWGKRVTGWKAIQIYKAAETQDGRLLDELRDIPQGARASGRDSRSRIRKRT